MENRVKEICSEINDMFYACFIQEAVDKEDYETAQATKNIMDEL
jgi:hypothetical protein